MHNGGKFEIFISSTVKNFSLKRLLIPLFNQIVLSIECKKTVIRWTHEFSNDWFTNKVFSLLFYEGIPSFEDIIIACQMANLCMQWDESNKMEIPLQYEIM